MPWLRAYVAKSNGDFDRIVDFEVEEGDYSVTRDGDDRGGINLKTAGSKKIKLKKGETAEYAELTFGEMQAHSG